MLILHKYTNSFSKMFLKEKHKLLKILGDKCIVEHIGSTAIPGVNGKGVIDIMLVFTNKKEINIAVKKLAKKGYCLSGNNKNRKGRAFMSSAGVRESALGDTHLHLITKDNDSYFNAVFFRDYLINHPREKQKYIDLKHQILRAVEGDRKKYTQMKKEFIKRTVKLAQINQKTE